MDTPFLRLRWSILTAHCCRVLLLAYCVSIGPTCQVPGRPFQRTTCLAARLVSRICIAFGRARARKRQPPLHPVLQGLPVAPRVLRAAPRRVN